VANILKSNERGNTDSIWKPGPHSQFFRSPEEWEADSRARVYGHQLRRAWDAKDGIGLWAVLCVEGKPMVYFKEIYRRDPERESEWHRRLWNQGTATMLVVQDAQEVRIYSGLARPEQVPAASQDDSRLVDIFHYVAHSLELAGFIRSVETGQFYRDRATKFSGDRAVDKYLLDNLGEARDQLCDLELEFPLPPSTAHAFLGRCLFTCYLLERGIIGEAQLRRAGANGAAVQATTLRELVEHLPSSDATDVLYGLFRVLKDDFNGSMFGGRLSGEKQHIRKRHIDVLHRFLRGDEMKTRQSVLFPLYDFRFIPIEFISAVYEDFLAAEDEKPKKKDSKGKTKRRKAGAYYTPPRLAELVVDIATEGSTSLLQKRFLDPACGSGIFLVILFQRLAEEWHRQNRRATNTKRARALRDLLTNNLCGVDVNETACMVACFSLYLAFMDQFDDPRDIWELADELKRTGTEKVLPLLMACGEDEDEEKLENPAIHVANFFGSELPQLGLFDLVIGNPPWVGRNQPADSVLEQWVLHESTTNAPGNPFIRELANCPSNEAGRRSWFLPNRQSANAFMWKAPIHAKPEGCVCLLLPSKVLLANQVDEFQSAWLQRFKVQAVWQLSDYRHILFEGAICPAAVIKFERNANSDNDVVIPYLVPKVDRLSPRSADLSVTSDDRKFVSLAEVLDATERDRAVAVWKKHFWGTGRDQELLNRLLNLPKLGDLADEPGKKRWMKGGGFQPYHEGLTKGTPKKAWWVESDLYLDTKAEVEGLLLLRTDCEKVGKRFRKLRRLSDEKGLFTQPKVLFNRVGSKVAFVDFPLLFQHTLAVITGPPSDANLLLFLTAVLNSQLARYFLFHTSANWGVERDTVLLDEYLRIPFPLPEQTHNNSVSRGIITRAANRLRETKTKLELLQTDLFLGFAEQRKTLIDAVKSELSGLVNDYYGLSDWERTLVAETVDIFEPSSTPPSLDTPIPTLRRTEGDDHRTYAEVLCTTLNGWLHRQPWKLTATAHIARRTGLGLLTLARSKQPGNFTEQPAANDFERVLLRIQKAAGDRQGGIAYARGFVFFESDRLHVLKPLTLKHWTKTAALNDADALMGFMATQGAHGDVDARR